MTDTALQGQALRLGKQAKLAARRLAPLPSAEKNGALLLMAEKLEAKSGFLVEENRKDLEFATANGVSSAMLDRIALNASRVRAMAQGLREVAALPDPVREVVKMWRRCPRSVHAERLPIRVGAVCVYHHFVPAAVEALAGSGIPVAAVSTGFPAGLTPMETKLREIELSVVAGAAEIDIVITRAHVLTSDWAALYDEVKAYRAACGHAHLKTILATGELGTLRDVARASAVCMMAGADFIKTSTGKEPVNATLPVGLVMARQIRTYHERTGHLVGLKPAGGIRTAKQSLDWLGMVKEELGV